MPHKGGDREVPVPPKKELPNRRARELAMAQQTLMMGSLSGIADGTTEDFMIKRAINVAKEFYDRVEALVNAGVIDADDLEDAGLL